MMLHRLVYGSVEPSRYETAFGMEMMTERPFPRN
jgi:hypothetical protein